MVRATLMAACLFASSLALADTSPAELTASYSVLDSTLTFHLKGSSAPALAKIRDAMAEEIKLLTEQLSADRPDSEIARLNAAAGSGPVRVSSATYQALEQALFFARVTQGVYDPTVGALMKLWENGHVPFPQEIQPVQDKVDYRNVVLSAENQAVALYYPGMRLDLSGIAKGFALDRAVELARLESTSEYVRIDWDTHHIYWSRSHSFSPAIRVNLEVPVPIRSNAALVTLAHPVLDPRTGYPSKEARRVTILASNAVTADAFSVPFMILGPQGVASLEQKPDAEALFVIDGPTGGLRTETTPGWPH